MTFTDLGRNPPNEIVLGTKFTNQTDPGDPNSADNHRKKIVASIEASLRRLQTDRIDLYWVQPASRS
jgi:aryl-alcohol dehydrogenase-like predicted oxidoreductase